MIPLKPTYKELEQRVKKLTNQMLELDRTEKEVQRIFNFAMDIIGSGNLQGYFTQINSSFGEMLGYSEKEILERPFIKFVHDDDVEKTKKALSDAGKGKKEIYIENRYKCKDGSYKWIEWKVLSIVKENKFIAVGRDFTDRKQTEETLLESNERFRNLTEMTSDWIWEVDKDACYTYASPKINEMLGYDPEEIIGKTPFDLMPPDEGKRVFKIFNNIASSQQPFDCLENVNLHKNGHTVVIETSATPIFSADGEFLGYRGIDRDITNRKQTEEALRESEQRYRSLAENTFVGFWQINLDGYPLYINPTMCQMLEVESPEELSGQTYESFFDDRNREIIKRELAKREKGISSSYEVELIGKKGTKRNVIISGSPLFSFGEKLHSVIGTLTDITDKKRAEKALVKAHAELEKRVKERTRELEIKTQNLEEANIAMKVLLKKREEDRKDIEYNVLTNVKTLIDPYVDKIRKTKLNSQRNAFLNIMESNLREITSQFARKISMRELNLTPTEIQVANMIKYGNSSKEIAGIMNVSKRTVDVHRRHIRKKIGLAKKKTNLRTYLLSLH